MLAQIGARRRILIPVIEPFGNTLHWWRKSSTHARSGTSWPRSRVGQIDIAGFDDATSSLIPIEVYEILREPRIVRVVILLLNVAVVAYLWRCQEVFE